MLEDPTQRKRFREAVTVSCSQSQMVQQTGLEEIVASDILTRDQPVRREDLRKDLQGSSEKSQPTDETKDAKARNDYWSIYRHHVEPRVQLYVPEEETFPIPLVFFDVTRTTHTNLDVQQESRIDKLLETDSEATGSNTNAKNKTCMHDGISWIHEKAFGIHSIKKSWRSHRAEKKIQFDKSLHLGAQVLVLPNAKAAVDKKWERLEKLPAWPVMTVKSKREVILEAQKEKRTVHFATLMDICHLKNAELEPKYQKKKGRVVLRHCERRLWSLCSICRTRLVCVSNDSSKSDGYHCKTTRLCRTRSRRSIRLHPGKNGRRTKLLELPKSECPDAWIRLRH